MGKLARLKHPNAQEVCNRAREVFGEEAKARSWMNTPRDIFANRSPSELLASGNEAEQRRILEVLLRIDYGVFS